MLYFLPLIGTFQSCQLCCRIRNLTLQQSVFRFQAVEMTCLQGGLCSLQESVVEQVKMPGYKGSCPSQPGTSARKEPWERMAAKLPLSLSEAVPERCCRQFTTFVRLQLDYICFHLRDRSATRPQLTLCQCSKALAGEIIKELFYHNLTSECIAGDTA